MQSPAVDEHVDAGPSDSCARLSPYCSLSISRYDISCGGQVTSVHRGGGRRRGQSVGAPAIGGFCPDFSAPTGEGFEAMTWTDERVETLKRLWTDGLSASQIAAELGGITRNAVIGKVHRLGLSGRAKSPSSAAPRPRKARPHQHMMRVSRPAVRGNTALAHAYDLAPPAERELVHNVVPMGQPRTLLELTEETCRWPIGDPGQADFFFCGGGGLTPPPPFPFYSPLPPPPPHHR